MDKFIYKFILFFISKIKIIFHSIKMSITILFFISFKSIITKEIIEKYSPLNINNSNIENNKTFLIDDFCNIGQSQIVFQFFQEILEYFNITKLNNDKCLILDNIFILYFWHFIPIMQLNKDSFIYFTCPICQKDFKTNLLLNLHYKLFHMKYNDSLICPGDFCMSINCNRYYEYFNVKKMSKNPQDVKFNRQPIEKDESCTDELIFFYKSNCMKLIENCFGDDKDKYYKYYKYVCNEIDCKNDLNSQITKESNLGDIFRYIFMYLFVILGIIYLILIWLNQYA